jgi:hypothetical protein
MYKKPVHRSQNALPSRVYLFARLLVILPVIIFYFHYFFPQNWGYFAIKPRGPVVNVFRVNDNNISNESLLKNNMSYGLGMARRGRVLYHELTRLVDHGGLAWKPFIKDSLLQIITTENFNMIESKYLLPKGKLLIIKENPDRSSMNKNSVSAAQYSLVETR